MGSYICFYIYEHLYVGEIPFQQYRIQSGYPLRLSINCKMLFWKQDDPITCWRKGRRSFSGSTMHEVWRIVSTTIYVRIASADYRRIEIVDAFMLKLALEFNAVIFKKKIFQNLNIYVLIFRGEKWNGSKLQGPLFGVAVELHARNKVVFTLLGLTPFPRRISSSLTQDLRRVISTLSRWPPPAPHTHTPPTPAFRRQLWAVFVCSFKVGPVR